MQFLSYIVTAVIFEGNRKSFLFWDSDLEASFLHFDALLFECLAAIGNQLPFYFDQYPPESTLNGFAQLQ